MGFRAAVFILFFIFSQLSFGSEDIVDKTSTKNRVFFEPVRFLSGVAPAKVESECLILEELKRSIIKSADDFGFEIDFLDEGASSGKIKVIKVELVEVNPNAWRVGSIRPHSSAKYRVAIYEDGKVIDSDERALNSSGAMRTCDRLEKIAKAFGRPLAQWVFLNIGGDELEESSLVMLRSDNAMALREIAKKLYNNADFSEAYLDAAAEKIWTEKDTKDKLMTDALAWLCNYIGLSKNGRYRSLFESIEGDLKRGKLKKYVKSALKKLPKVSSEEKQFNIHNEASATPNIQ